MTTVRSTVGCICSFEVPCVVCTTRVVPCGLTADRGEATLPLRGSHARSRSYIGGISRPLQCCHAYFFAKRLRRKGLQHTESREKARVTRLACDVYFTNEASTRQLLDSLKSAQHLIRDAVRRRAIVIVAALASNRPPRALRFS